MFETLKPTPPDKIIELLGIFREDPRTDKIDLGVGVYKDEAGRTPVMRAVKAAEAKAAKEDPNTAILEKISNTLLGIASWDKTANSILVGEVKYLAQVMQAVGDGSLDPSVVRGAVMAIGAGAA